MLLHHTLVWLYTSDLFYSYVTLSIRVIPPSDMDADTLMMCVCVTVPDVLILLIILSTVYQIKPILPLNQSANTPKHP